MVIKKLGGLFIAGDPWNMGDRLPT